MVNTLFSKVPQSLHENEKYTFYFYLKIEGTFCPIQYIYLSRKDKNGGGFVQRACSSLGAAPLNRHLGKMTK